MNVLSNHVQFLPNNVFVVQHMMLIFIEKKTFSVSIVSYTLPNLDIAIYDDFSNTRRWQILSNIRHNTHNNIAAHGPCSCTQL